MYPITISNPEKLREILRIALEVSYVDLSQYQSDSIRNIIDELPNSIESIIGCFSSDQVVDLYMCIRHFRRSYTFRCISEDLHKALYDLESKIVKTNSVS